MKCNSLTNRLKVKFEYSVLLKRYKILKIKNISKAESFQEYAKFYQSIKKELTPLAHTREKAYTIVALERNVIVPKSFTYEYTILEYAELKRVKDYAIMNLLLSLLVRESSYFDVSDDPYGLYYLAEIKEQNNPSYNIIITIKIAVDTQMYLTLNVVTFRKIYSGSKKDLKQDRYIISGNKLIKSDEADESTCYIKGGVKGQKQSFPFMNFSYGYEDTKIFILHQFIHSFRSRFKDIAKVAFERLSMNSFDYGEGSSDALSRVKKSIVQSLKGCDFNIVNYTDINLDTEIKELQENILEYFSNTVTVKQRQRLSKKSLNITITFPKDFYEKEKICDPYTKLKKLDAVSQNISLIKNKLTITKTILHVLLKELLMKQDIKERKVSIAHNSLCGFTFVMIDREKESSRYKKVYIKESIMSFENLSEEETAHCNRCVSYAKSDNKEIEIVIITDDGDVNYIVRTKGFVLPEIEDIDSLYSERVKSVKPISKVEVLKTFDIIFNPLITQENRASILEHRGKINALKLIDDENIDLQKLKKLFMLKGEPKEASSSFKKAITELSDASIIFNIKAKSYIKLIASLSGIRYTNDNDNYSEYSVGIPSIHQATANMSKAIQLRELHRLQGKLLTLDILEMMNEYFVKNGSFTVLPYPIKYVKEYYKHKID